MWITTAAESREMDRISHEEFGIPAVVLMERAGLAVFDAVKQLLPEGGKLCLLCGKGNNGGDGLVVARLAAEAGYGADVFIAAEEHELSPDCATQLAISKAQGITPIFANDARFSRKLDCIGVYDLVIDALMGTGIKYDPQGPVLEAIRAVNRAGVPVVSVDIPSGIEPDTGAELGESIWALRTITMGLPKPYLFQGIGLEHAGYWTVADIGYPANLLRNPTDAHVLDSSWVNDLIPERLRSVHKRDNGHVLMIAGCDSMPGAAILACQGALRAGAGLVTLASTAQVCDAVVRALPEVITLPLPSVQGGIGRDAADLILGHQSICDSAVIGPGLGTAVGVHDCLARLFAGLELPCCLDAEALNAIAAGVPLPATEIAMTPHPGELGRLLQHSAAEIQANRFQSVRDAVDRFGVTVALKGPHTIIGAPDLPMAVNSTGNSGMATAGMGDVLSGIVGTLLAQDLPAFCASAVAVYWHGLAGDLCADQIGPVGFLASDVAGKLPQARAKLAQSCPGASRVRSLPLSCQL